MLLSPSVACEETILPLIGSPLGYVHDNIVGRSLKVVQVKVKSSPATGVSEENSMLKSLVSSGKKEMHRFY